MNSWLNPIPDCAIMCVLHVRLYATEFSNNRPAIKYNDYAQLVLSLSVIRARAEWGHGNGNIM